MNSNQADLAGKKDCPCGLYFAVIIVMIIALGVGITLIPLISSGSEKTVNVPKLFEKFDIQDNLWKTLISAQDDQSKIDKESNDKVNTNSNSLPMSPIPSSYYIKAKSYVATLLYPFKPNVDDFSYFSTQMESKIQKILVDVFKLSHDSSSKYIMEIAKKIFEKNKSAEVLIFKAHMKKMQEAYVKQMTKIFGLRPEDFDATPEYFCEVFGLCEFLKKPLSSDEKENRKSMFKELGISF